MQQIERLLGFKMQVDQTLEPHRITVLQKKARMLAKRYHLDPRQYYVYIHSLSLFPTDGHFLKNTKLHDRMSSLVLGFYVNPKQEFNGKIRLYNYLFNDLLEPMHTYANSNCVQYTMTARELESGAFRNELITFVSKSLPKKNRKLKIAIMARPTDQCRSKLHNRGNVVTRKDLRFERFTPLELPRTDEAPATTAGLIWRSSSRTADLHCFLHDDIEILDVGEMTRMIERSSGVCRVEVREKALGTGVLITPTLVLTNHHVLEKAGIEVHDLASVVRDVALRFGAITDSHGNELPGQVFRLHQQAPIVEISVTNRLDFVLLRVTEGLPPNFKPVPFELTLPARKETLNILQYPYAHESNSPLKLTLQPNGITGVYPRIGKIQYLTRATRGASGAPCFSKEWKMIAIHRAETMTHATVRREGVLFSSIHTQIAKHLETD